MTPKTLSPSIPAEPLAPSAETPVAIRINGVDGLRAFAALIVVLFHCFGEAGGPEWRPFFRINVLRPFHDGWVGVNLFLILSGFCLYWPFVSRPGGAFDVRAYAKRRIWRIVPTYYFSLLIVSVGAALWAPLAFNESAPFPTDWRDIALHITLLHSLHPATICSWNSVTWSLGLEWTWYFVFPFALMAFKKMGPTKAFGLMIAITIVYRVVAACLVSPGLTGNEIHAIRNFIPGRLLEFGAGMWVAWRVKQGPVSPTLLKWIPAIGAALVVVGHLLTPVAPLVPARDLIYCAAGSLLLLFVVAGGNRMLSRQFSKPWLCKIGVFSYTLYLFHYPMLAAVKWLCMKSGFTGPALFFVMLPFIVPITFLCWALYLVVEKPFLQRGKSRKAQVSQSGQMALAPQ